MPTSPFAPVVIPPAVFSATLAAHIRRTRAQALAVQAIMAQNSPVNDGRTGYIVNYFA